jgi:hypothetical protein
MKNKLSPRDRLWVFADPSLKELIIRCELHLAKPITVEDLRQLVQERLIQNFERFSWIISSGGHTKRANNLDLAEHVTANNQIAIDPQRPLWQFNLVNNSKIEIGVHHALADGLSLVAILRKLTEEKPVAIKSTKSKARPSWSMILRTIQGVFKALFVIFLSPNVKLADAESNKNYSSKDWSRPDKLTNRTDFETILENLILDPALEIKENSIIAVPISISSLTNRINNGLGNKFALSPLPKKSQISIVDEFRTMKKQGEVLGAYFISVFIGSMPTVIGRYLSKFVSSHIFGIVSGVQVSRFVLKLLGSEITHIKAWAPILSGQKFSITSVHYKGEVTLNQVIRS